MESKKKTLTRADIAEAIVNVFDLTRIEASGLVDQVLLVISDTLADGEPVKISGFGTFFVRQKKERMGRNPRTLKEALISSRKAISFKSSALLKKAVNDMLS
ncbi:MAG: integration host factor subunit alpha [Puniceicoccales bacterium]|jgi:integration host factor subunit alpha|nr:integration host factor subunit alpha [Puniceicoccales bacterium]